jgi:hypothetical protein
MTIHQNSFQSYQEIANQLSSRQAMIFQILTQARKGLTDRQILNFAGLHDMNQVRPRITELIRSGLVQEIKSVKCPITDRKVRVVKAIAPQPQMKLKL